MCKHFSGHRYAFTCTHKSLYSHFHNYHRHPTLDINITLLEWWMDKDLRLKRELEWIQLLDTYLPGVLNTKAPLAKYLPDSTCTNTSSSQPHTPQTDSTLP